MASYDHEGISFDKLSKVNFIYGGNGTGKTTFGRMLAHLNDFPSCKIEWEGKPVEVVMIDDPVCSLDADSMFVVSEMVWRILDCARNQKTPRWRVLVWKFYWKKESLG